MIRYKKIIVLFFLLTGFSLLAEQIRKEDFVKVDDCSTDSYYLKMIDLGHDEKVRVCVYVHSHGFGTLFVVNLILYVYHDEHGNGVSYENDLLNVDFIDMNEDGYKDIVITGRVDYRVDVSENVKFIYTYFPSDKKFYCTFRDSSFRLEDGPVYKRNLFLDSKKQLLTLINEGRKKLKIKEGDTVCKKNETEIGEEIKPPDNGKYFESEDLRNEVTFGLKNSEIVYLLATSEAVFFKKLTLPYIKNSEVFNVICGGGIAIHKYAFTVVRNLQTGECSEISEHPDSFNLFIKDEQLKLSEIKDLEGYVKDIIHLIYPKNCKILNSFESISYSANETNKLKDLKLFGPLIKPLIITINSNNAQAILFVLHEGVLIEKRIKINADCTVKIDDMEHGIIKTSEY